MPDIDTEPQGPKASGPWGPGGFEVPVYPDDQDDLRNFIRSHVPSLSAPLCVTMARYICAMEHSRAAGGPPKVSAIDRALEQGTAYDLVSRNKWNWRVVRHQVTSSTITELADKPDGIVISTVYTDYDDPAMLIVTAHAFNRAWRMLIAVQRALVDANGRPLELEKAFGDVIDEVAAFRAKLAFPVPVLVESPAVGQGLVQYLAASNLDYLVELTPGWSEGGLIPISTGDPSLPSAAGVPIRGLFPTKPLNPEATESRPVRLTAWSKDLYTVALIAGVPSRRRTYLADARDASQRRHHNSISLSMLERWASKWARHDLSGAIENYGLRHFRAKTDHFHRHFAIVAVRDAYAVSGRAS